MGLQLLQLWMNLPIWWISVNIGGCAHKQGREWEGRGRGRRRGRGRGEGEGGGCKDEVFSDSESQGPGGLVLDFRFRGMGVKAWMGLVLCSWAKPFSPEVLMAAIKLSWQLDVTALTAHSLMKFPLNVLPFPPSWVVCLDYALNCHFLHDFVLVIEFPERKTSLPRE